jgi:hypothetical protein
MTEKYYTAQAYSTSLKIFGNALRLASGSLSRFAAFPLPFRAAAPGTSGPGAQISPGWREVWLVLFFFSLRHPAESAEYRTR